MPSPCLLTLNAGSSSLKATLYGASDAPVLAFEASGIGQATSRVSVGDANHDVPLPDHASALAALWPVLEAHGLGQFQGLLSSMSGR